MRCFRHLLRALLPLAIAAGIFAADKKGSISPPVEAVHSAPSAEEIKVVTAFVAQLAAQTGGPLLRLIAPGEFTMGDSTRNEAPSHRVVLTSPFFLGANELTQAQWTAVMGTNPSRFDGANRPVENVSWEDAMAFCQKLNERERAAGRLPASWAFTLPTEAQWEFACRAGTTGDYAGDLNAMGWSRKDGGGETHAVGLKLANAWGLSDMHGNVWEWSLDFYAGYPGDGKVAVDPTGPSTSARGNGRVIRGGSFETPAEVCRSAYRAATLPRFSQFSSAPRNSGQFGFRLALVFSR